jgi:protein-tyrosine kinase
VSLVEQTIARLRRQQGATAAKAGRADRSPHVAAPGAPADRMEDTASLAKQITVDNAALRARGYFPEPSKDRQFAGQFRRIKRPLIEKALSGVGAAGDDPRIIMVTSALPGDGKTFTSVNLALSMAQDRDVTVLLIDADVAKRDLSGVFGLKGQPGLLDVLVDETLEAESVIVPTTTRGFSILPVGNPVAGTEELLSSARMRKIMASLCARNPRRVLLLDSPPLLVTNEGRALLKVASQVVLVIRAEATPRDAIQAAISLFDPQHAGGLVLNQVRSKWAQRYYEYEYYGTDEDQT